LIKASPALFALFGSQDVAMKPVAYALPKREIANLSPPLSVWLSKICLSASAVRGLIPVRLDL
jgi:hypothetical protein